MLMSRVCPQIFLQSLKRIHRREVIEIEVNSLFLTKRRTLTSTSALTTNDHYSQQNIGPRATGEKSTTTKMFKYLSPQFLQSFRALQALTVPFWGQNIRRVHLLATAYLILKWPTLRSGLFYNFRGEGRLQQTSINRTRSYFRLNFLFHVSID